MGATGGLVSLFFAPHTVYMSSIPKTRQQLFAIFICDNGDGAGERGRKGPKQRGASEGLVKNMGYKQRAGARGRK
jgi:hypothetical protein